jgi:cyclic beta-1,2-glucan synthetase
MPHTAISEKKTRIYSIGEATSAARSLAASRTFRQGKTLSLLPRLDTAALRLAAQPAGRQKSVQSQLRALRKALAPLQNSRMPLAADGPCLGFLRLYEIASSLCSACAGTLDEPSVSAFISEYQSASALTLGELASMHPVLTLALLESLAAGPADHAELWIDSLKAISRIDWEAFLEHHSRTEAILARDPFGAYSRMTPPTRAQYRGVVADIARHSDFTEEQVAEAAIALSQAEPKDSRQSHVGYFLLSHGLKRLKTGLSYRPSPRQRLVDFVRAWPTAFYLYGVELVTLLIAIALLSQVHQHLSELALILFLLSTEPAIAFMNLLTQAVIPPRLLPRMDFSEGIPAGFATMVTVPTLLLSDKYIQNLLSNLEIYYHANRDPRISFALLTDLPDLQHASAKSTEADEKLIRIASEGVEDLNRRYSRDGLQPFYLFHRKREWNPKEGAWMGWERKRGKIIALNDFLRGEDDAFDVKIGDLDRARFIKFVITLDSDTELPRGAARELAGTLAHPLNRPVIDPLRNIVVEGYGILQPRVGISISSSRRSNLASIYSGQTGFDPYTKAVSDSYQDLFCEGSYCGKGIYDVDTFQTTLARRFPQDTLLSHDLIEGSYARAGLVSDIEVIDDYPSHYSAWSKRKHRWVRGDWQIVKWLLPTVPGYRHPRVLNPLSVISLWKILDNLRRSVMEISIFVLLIAGWTFLPGGPVYWTLTVSFVAFLPVYMRLAFSLLRTPPDSLWTAHIKESLSAFVSGHLEVFLQFVFLAHQTCLMLDAIVRAVVRTTVTGRRLLEWESAAQAEWNAVPAFHSINAYLFLASPIAAIAAALIAYTNPRAFWVASPFLLAWLFSPLVTLWLNARLISPGRKVPSRHRKFLKSVARRTWSFFDVYSNARHHFLIPDNVREVDGVAAVRTSPTNIGMLLNAHLAALDFGFVEAPQCAERIARILDTLEKMERFRGHFFNWYDTTTLAVLPPRYVSTVDSGNLAAALLTLKCGMLEIGENSLAARAAALFDAMDFSFLLDPKTKLLYLGFDDESRELDACHFDSLASEARIASFVAIAKNDIPHENWLRLGRLLTAAAGHRVLLSWSGTMFEYLMPCLWLRNYGDTLLDRTAHGAVKAQREFAARHRVPWGISESAFAEIDGGEYGYYAFGVPKLTLKPDTGKNRLVIAPYASALALMVDPAAAARNLRKLARRGWLSPFGFYEAADFTRSREQEDLVKIHMAHHQGMALLALDNVLNRCRMQKRFHSDPMVRATELLLQERPSMAAPLEN